RPGDVRRRNHRGDPRGNRIDAFGRDDVVRERGAPTAVGVAGPWVIDQPRGFGKIAPPARQGRHGGKPGSELSLAGALVAGEEEKLIAFDRSAVRAAELVIYELRVAFPLWQKKILGLERVVAVVFERRAVEVVGPTLDLHVDGGTAGQSLFRVEAV